MLNPSICAWDVPARISQVWHGRVSHRKESCMQNGSIIRAARRRGPEIWEFRWREPGPDGKRKHRRMIIGSVEQLPDEEAARKTIAALRVDINRRSPWLRSRPSTLGELAEHYRQRELEPDIIWKTHSTKVTYEGYLNKWILPRWQNYP